MLEGGFVSEGLFYEQGTREVQECRTHQRRVGKMKGGCGGPWTWHKGRFG